MWVCLQRSSPSAAFPRDGLGRLWLEWEGCPVVRNVMAVGLPCSSGLRRARALSSWHGICRSIPKCISVQSAHRFGVFPASCSCVPCVAPCRHLLRVLNLSSQGKLGSSQCLLLLAGGWVSSGLPRIKSGTFRAGDSDNPCGVQGWWHSPHGGRVDVTIGDGRRT